MDQYLLTAVNKALALCDVKQSAYGTHFADVFSNEIQREESEI